MLADPDIGLSNTNASPTRLIGWISYCAIESFGSICVSLFWAFVNSIMHFDGAKSSYGLIVAGAQVYIYLYYLVLLGIDLEVMVVTPLVLFIHISCHEYVICTHLLFLEGIHIYIRNHPIQSNNLSTLHHRRLFLFDGSKVGSILGPTIAAKYASTFGVPLLYGIGGGCMGFMVSGACSLTNHHNPIVSITCRIPFTCDDP